MADVIQNTEQFVDTIEYMHIVFSHYCFGAYDLSFLSRTEEEDSSAGNSSERALQKIELESIRSRHSNRPDVVAVLGNHVYDETELDFGYN